VWEDGSWTPLPALDGDVTADVCVIGLGGSGLTAVQELEAHGATVVGLDAGPVGGGAAGRNGGFLLAGLARPYHQAVAQLGRETSSGLYRRTLEEMDRTAHRRVGSLRIETELLADCAAQAAALRADGFLREDLGVEAAVTHRWAASVGYTEDHLPFLGEVRPGVWAAGGYCGTGNVVGALCARQAACAALGVPADFWLPPT
jgi:glycine/D-amino acid oxidase-like deaminating enzyme